MKLDDGGAAFPGKDLEGFYYEGMSLRDWFAGTAMNVAMTPLSWQEKDENEWAEWLAELSYKIADAMLIERDKETT